MSQEPADTQQSLRHRVLIAALIVFTQDLSGSGGAQAWTYNYSVTPNRRWPQARQWCQQHFTDMVAIQSQEETDFINNLLPFNPRYYWIGVHKVDGVWTREGNNEGVPEGSQNWAVGEPDDITGQDCVEVYIKRERDTAMWNNEKCHAKKGSVCYTASCTQDSCGAHADCVETVGNYTCRCHPGFHGPRCEEAIACEPLSDPEQGSHDCFHPYGINRYNSSCRFHCELGFRLVGMARLVCQTGGRWNHDVPLCQVEHCPALNRISSSAGRMNCSHPIAPDSYNSTCDFSCEEGHELRGEAQTRCDHAGQWTASVPACTITKCAPVFFPTAGNVTCVDTVEPFSFGSRCDFSCQEGYHLSGDNTLACLASGQWSKPTPTCEVVQCNRLEAPPNASMQCQDPLGDFSYGSTCSVQCEEGFNLMGTNMTTCFSRGNWSHTLPVCLAKRCDPLNPPSHGSLSCSDPNGEFSFGSRCTSTCDEGFLLNGTARAECTSLGAWNADIPRCLAKRCDPLNPPSHGSLSCSDPNGEFSFGSRCTSTCDEGFLLNGTVRAECTSLGAWSRDVPRCLARRCPTLNSPPNGSLTCSDPHGESSFGSRCTSTCEEGFLLNGTAETGCTSVGTWSTGLPNCLAKKCPPLDAPSHGSSSCSGPHGEFSFGSRCTSTCREGFVLNGTAHAECTSLGAWSGEAAYCRARPCPLLAKAPQHGRMTCSHPHSPFSFDSHCHFECHEGFRLRGAPTTTCDSSGLWSRDRPTCELVRCEAILALSSPLSTNCSHPLGNFSFGSRCLFTCEGGFSLNGTELLLCSSTGVWSDSQPNCTEDLPVGAAMLLYGGVGAASVVVSLVLIGLALLILTRSKRRGITIISDLSSWEERENPAFEF